MLDRIAATHEHYLNLLTARQKLVAGNLANVDTPGYQARDIDFQHEFRTLAHGEKPEIYVREDLPTGNDGNNVDVDREARLLAENAIRFQFVTLMAKGQFRQMRQALQEGRG